MINEKIWSVKDGYLVNRDGSIYKLNWKRKKIMRKIKQNCDKDGYLYFKYQNRLMKSHRFVAECFIPNPENLPCINHKDENKQNNCVDNLEWCTHKYNTNYGTAMERLVKTRSKKVYQYTKDGEFVKEWFNVVEIGKVLGLCTSDIYACCANKPHHKSAYGFIWTYQSITQ